MHLSLRSSLSLLPALWLSSLSANALAQGAPPPIPPAPPPAEPAPAAEPPPAAPAPIAPAPQQRAEQPPAATPAPPEPASAAPVAPTAGEAKAEEREDPERLAVGKHGFFQPAALLQGWFFLQSQDNDDVYPPSDTQTTFRIRRAEIRVRGEILPKRIGYVIMIDPARALDPERVTIDVESEDPMAAPATVSVLQPPGGNGSIFQDYVITFFSEYADVSMGQFKIPVSLDGVTSSSRLLFPERSLVSRRYGDRRDIGVKAEKRFGPVYYYAGLFNGEGQNRLDTNNQKDASLRVEVSPIEGLMVGAVGYVAIGERDLPGTKDRIEGDLKLEIADAVLMAEYIHAWDRTSSERVRGHGLAVTGGYTIADRIQPVARFGFLDQDLEADLAAGGSDEVTSYEIGANYYIEGNEAKLQLQLGLFDFEDAPTQYQGTLAVQVGF